MFVLDILSRSYYDTLFALVDFLLFVFILSLGPATFLATCDLFFSVAVFLSDVWLRCVKN